LFWVAALVAGFYALCGVALLGLKWIDPPITMVQIQRRVQAAIHRRPYRRRYVFVPPRITTTISPRRVSAAKKPRGWRPSSPRP